MPIKIKFDSTHNVQSPTYVLATKSGRKLGKLPAYNITFKDSLNSYSEIFFRVNKTDCISHGNKFWNQIKDFKLMYCKEYDMWFELTVELDESNHLVKNVTAKSLGESELSQINLYGVEINTENDILREDYEPTVLFDETNKKVSLLNRITEKVPHYIINHVDISIANIQRTFTFDNISIYNALQEISQEINCIFIIRPNADAEGKIRRTIDVYDLESFCLECGKRDEFSISCPECGSQNILTGYGEDTTIFVSTDNLAENIQYSTNVDSVKNCFKLTAGDDLMTATLANCNPNGSGYIWYISDEVKEDMSQQLVNKLSDYDKSYNHYQKEYEILITSDLLNRYNSLIDKYTYYSSDLTRLPEKIIGYPALMNAYYNTIDFYLFLNNGLMPNIEMQNTTAVNEVAKLNVANLSPVAVQNIDIVSSATATNAVLAMAKTIVDPRYQVKVNESLLDGTTWVGNFIVTNYSDEDDTAISARVSVQINDDYEIFVEQKLDKSLKQSSNDNTDIIQLFKLDLDSFVNEIKKYSLSMLTLFYDSCQTCLDLLIEQGIADRETWANQSSDLYKEIYTPYYNKLTALSDEIKLRESEIAIIIGVFDKNEELVTDGIQTIIESERNKIQSILNFESFLGEELWLEFVTYRREDTYQNNNYISDGLNNAELFKHALEFIEIAKKDIYKSATLQHTITANLKNLLVMKEFSPIIDYFAVGNWIRVRVDGVVYKLRIVEFEIDYDNLDNISIVFSDVKSGANGISDAESILNQAASMSTSYDTVLRQAGQGKKSSEQLDNWVAKGLALTKMKIIDSADNQNVTLDSHGLLCREYLPITNTYDDKQLKLINRGLYLTNDNWLTSKAGIGNFTFYNPETREMEEGYGVIADTLIGNLVLSEKVGIYNKNNTIVLGENGLVITADTTNGVLGKTTFAIQKQEKDNNDNIIVKQLMYVDAEGNLVLNGTIRINSNTDASVSTLDELADTNRLTEQINSAVHSESQLIYNELDAKYIAIIQETTKQLESYKADIGQYMQFNENGLTLGASTSAFKTVIDNRGMYFKQGDTIVSYVNNNQLYIPNAVIENTLILGNFFFSPRNDGGVSLTWQGE